MAKQLYRSLVIIIFIVMLFAAARPYAVRADDSPPTPAPEATEVPTDQPVVEPEATEAPVVDSTTAEPEATAVAEVLAAVPEGTDVVLLDSEGNSVPLADASAGDIILSGDPMWCPTGKLPGDPSCTPQFAEFTSTSGLLYFLSNNAGTYYGPGVIYVEDGYDTAGPPHDSTAGVITLDPLGLYGLPTLTDITVQGGWNFSSNSVTGQSTFRIPLYVQNWPGDVTLNDLLVQDISAGTGLVVSETNNGSITLNDVEVKNSAGPGARVMSAGSGSISVQNNSSFHDNTSLGLYVSTDGSITLDNVSANDNGWHGAQLVQPFGGAGYGPISVDSSTFNGNTGGDGLHVQGYGDVSLSEVTANQNAGAGANVDTCLYNGILARCDGSGDVSVTDSTFGGASLANSGDGLDVTANGDITLDHVSSTNNGNDGAYLDNCVYNGSGNCPASGTINVSGSDFSSNNDDSGLEVYSGDKIDVNSVTASNNGGDGAELDNCNFGSSACNGSGDVLVTSSTFGGGPLLGNDADGLYVSSDGNVTLKNTVTSTYNAAYGAEIYTTGEISLTDVTADFNGEYGAWLDNGCGCSGSDVFVSNSTFDSNGWNSNGYDAGLDIESYGDVTLNSMSASNNTGGDGADIGLVYGVFTTLQVHDSVFNSNSNGVAQDGWGMGLYVFYGEGDVELVNVQASGNEEDGAVIYTAGNVFVDPSYFNNNAGDGLYIDTTLTLTTGDVVLECVTATGNGDTGLFVDTPDSLTLNNVTVSGNSTADTNVTTGSPVVVLNTANCATGGGGSKKPVTGGNPFFLIDCANPATYTELLPTHEQVVFSLLCGYQGMLVVRPAGELPGGLPDGNKYVDGVEAQVVDGSAYLQPLPAGAFLIVSFPVLAEGEFAIMHWTGSVWVEVPGERTSDGRYEAKVTEPGIYVLVSK